MMLLGAVAAAWVSTNVGGPAIVVLPLAILAAMVAAGLGASIHAFLTITLRVNQIISGLALTIFAGAAGLSSYLAGIWHLGQTPVANQFLRLDVFGLADAPIVGPILFHQTLLTYFSWILVIAASLYLFKTRMGLHLRAVGESPQTADSVGIPDLMLVGAYLFGALSSLSLTLQARGFHISTAFLAALPYVMTIVVLVIASNASSRRQLGAPAALGKPYEREER